MDNILISPSILNADFSHLEEECISLQNSGADWLHCDVMDGKFVPNTALNVKDVFRVKQAVSLPLDVHLMVKNPLRCVHDYIEIGASVITFHVETLDIEKTAELIRHSGLKVGLSVKPATPVEVLLPYADCFDMVLIMTVEPGFGGQGFLYDCLGKIKNARTLFPKKIIEVDGGINDKTAALAVEAGADVLVSGSYIIKSPNRAEAIRKLKTL